MTNLTDYSALLAEARAVQEISTERGDFPDTDLELITRLVDALTTVQADLEQRSVTANDSYLRKLIGKGIAERYPNISEKNLALIERELETIESNSSELAKAVAAVGLPEGTSLEGLIKQHTVNARLAGVFDGIASEKKAIRALQSPDGWFYFGAHLDFDGPLQFSVELSEDGLPKWERPLPLTANADTTVPATPHHSTEED